MRLTVQALDEVGLRVHADLPVDRREVIANGARGKVHAARDRRHAVALQQAGEDLALTAGEVVETGKRVERRDRRARVEQSGCVDLVRDAAESRLELGEAIARVDRPITAVVAVAPVRSARRQ